MLFSNSVPLPLVCEQLTGIGGVICTFFVCVYYEYDYDCSLPQLIFIISMVNNFYSIFLLSFLPLQWMMRMMYWCLVGGMWRT